MSNMMPIITLTTDFGTVDGYVGAMKGVILNICPQAHLADITHAVPPQDVLKAAFSLYNAAAHFPAGTVHLVVVDPGVGTERRALAVQSGDMYYVGPDNGVFSLACDPSDAAVSLENPALFRAGGTSSTFHGRDIFAPAAAHLANGVPLSEFGPRITNRIMLTIPRCIYKPPNEWIGQVLYLDAFGNAITNIGPIAWKEQSLLLTPLFGDNEQHLLHLPAVVAWQDRQFQLLRTYAGAGTGAPLALVSSNGLLEIAVRDGNAAKTLGIKINDPVVLKIH